MVNRDGVHFYFVRVRRVPVGSAKTPARRPAATGYGGKEGLALGAGFRTSCAKCGFEIRRRRNSARGAARRLTRVGLSSTRGCVTARRDGGRKNRDIRAACPLPQTGDCRLYRLAVQSTLATSLNSLSRTGEVADREAGRG